LTKAEVSRSTGTPCFSHSTANIAHPQKTHSPILGLTFGRAVWFPALIGRLCHPACRTPADINFGDYLPNGFHLKSYDAIQLLTSDVQLPSSRAQAAFSASESYFANFDVQRSDLHADALRHRSALRRRIDIFCSAPTVR
jgi:hypothetical protein